MTRLIILLALLIGVLYCLHLLVKDYQAITAGRLLRFFIKRDTTSQYYSKPNVRWKKILHYDPLQCARSLFCDVGAKPPDSEVRRGFIFMLTVEPREEDKSAQEYFIKSYNVGRLHGHERCKEEYFLCPFPADSIFQIVHYLLTNPYPNVSDLIQSKI